jgi:formylglycine-generating enzyme required for sulfatase activity
LLQTANLYSPSKFQTFKFEVATILTGRFNEPRKEMQLQVSHQQAWQMIELLGNKSFLEMIVIPQGNFLMGAPKAESESLDSERPQHSVTLKSFLLSKYPVTQAQWETVAELNKVNYSLNPRPSKFRGDNRPVEEIFWHEAVEFCNRVSCMTGKNYRLPTEAEWEYACRAKTMTPFHFGQIITTELVNYDGNYSYCTTSKGLFREETLPVGSFAFANAFGLYDMHGNVWEWCADHWHENYEGAPSSGMVWLSNSTDRRVLRGGSWINHPMRCRAAYRLRGNPGYKNDSGGFRIACDSS